MELIKKTGFKKLQLNKNPVLFKKSFNEDVVVGYEDIGHKYTYNDKQLTGVTEYTKKFYSTFELEMVAKSCGKNWDIDPQVVVDLWESNKRIAQEFGTAIHNALEHYEIWSSTGEMISAKREDEENYALPNHPALRNIIKEFIAINPVHGEVVTEALITWIDGGLCGRADRIVILDKDKKVCRVGDYKINVDSEKKDKNYKVSAPFDTLPNTKITKYQIQMSIYANMLEKSGWTVEGLDLYVYDSEWKYTPLPVLQVV